MPDAAICKVTIIAKCGSAHESQDSWGVAHFLEHMCFQGTENKNKHQVSRGQALVGNYNAYTSTTNTGYHFDSLNEDFEKGLVLLKEAVFDSNYPENEFEKEKSVIIEEWRMYDNYPTEHFWDFLSKECFGDEGHPIIGTQESIQSMNPEKLISYRNKWYGKENMVMVVVGNIDFERVMNAVDETLPMLKTVEKANICYNSILAQKPNNFMTTSRFEQAAFGMIYKSPSMKECIENAYKPIYFDWAFSKYLYEYIRDDLGLCYGISNGGTGHLDNQYSTISMLTNNDYIDKAEKEIENVIAKLQSEGFPEEIFEICKKQQLYNKIKSLQSVGGVANTIITGLNSSSDDNWFLDQGQKMLDIETMKKFAADLKPSDLQAYAQEYLVNFTKFSMLSIRSGEVNLESNLQ